ncbi:type II toxin-antitoxin system VapC family toxin [Gordonia sp. 4N]|uniref:type II toxin-antitoxin system VapC family toxin n=1 Tax=Gordonia sp. 4N TaxID=2993508 RepID=UPI00224908C8|nr:type II toxin-antitoxin system VapC family toxin [Gordonia sp. 4N]MCX2755535.1 type II toxin-antitoxin system VapC family toxin [Gordonia sp. 4N]
MIYLDTSAMVKLVVREAETAPLIEWLALHPGVPTVTSALGRVELMRTALRDGSPGLHERARDLLDALDVIPLSAAVIDIAESIGPSSLRSLDALHLASATVIRAEMTAFVAYDQRLTAAASALGHPVVAPGAEL